MFIIYGLHEADKPDEIRYVGLTSQTLQERLAGHLTAAWRNRHPVNAWVSHSKKTGTKIECREIQQVKDTERGAILEKKWIAFYALKGSLLNIRHNPKTQMPKAKQSSGPNPEDSTFGNKAVENFLQYLRALPM